MADHLAISSSEEAGPTLAHLQDQVSDSFATGDAPYHFLCLPEAPFGPVFSSSSDRSGLASDTSVPPYLVFQL
jgi:hypothetical protein